MALPYNTADPFALMDPSMEAEILAEQEFNPAGYPATDPFIEELEAEMEAEEAARTQPVDLSAAAEMSANFDAMAQQGQAPVDPGLEAEMLGMGPQLAAPEIPAQYIGGLPELDGAPVAAPLDGLEQPHALTEEGSRYDYTLQDLANAPANPEYDEIAGDVDPALLTGENLKMRIYDTQQAEAKKRRELELEVTSNAAKRKLEDEQHFANKLAEADKMTADLFAKSEALAREKIDKDRYVDDMSWGQKAAGFLSILAGGQLGLLSGRGGNEALQFFMSEINRDIEEQKYNLESQAQNIDQQKGLVAEIYRQTGNAKTAADTARLAVTEAAMAEIDVQMAKLDPGGSQFLEREMQKRTFAADRDAQRAKIVADNRKAAREDAELEIKAHDTQSQIDKRAEETLKLRAEREKLERRGTGKKEDEKFSPEFFKSTYGVDVPFAMSQKEFNSFIGTKKNVKELAGGGVGGVTAVDFPGDETAQELLARGVDPKTFVQDPVTGEVVGASRFGSASAEALQGALGDYHHTMALTDRLIAQYAEGGEFYRLEPTERKRRFDIDRAQLMAAIAKQLAGGGIPGNVQEEQASKLVPDLNKVMNSTGGAAVEQVQVIAESTVKKALQGANVDHDPSKRYPADRHAKNRPSKARVESAIEDLITDAPDKRTELGTRIEGVGSVISDVWTEVDKAWEAGEGGQEVAHDRKLALERLRSGVTDQDERILIDNAIVELENFIADPKPRRSLEQKKQEDAAEEAAARMETIKDMAKRAGSDR